jgi:hypothetical protein
MNDHMESDIGAAAFLLVRGFKVTGLKQIGPHRYGFCFADSGRTAAKEVQGYFAGATAQAKALLDSLRNLKDQLYAQKANGNGHAETRYFPTH